VIEVLSDEEFGGRGRKLRASNEELNCMSSRPMRLNKLIFSLLNY